MLICRDIFVFPKGKYFLFLNAACCLCKKLQKFQMLLAFPLRSLVRAFVCFVVHSNEKLRLMKRGIPDTS